MENILKNNLNTFACNRQVPCPCLVWAELTAVDSKRWLTIGCCVARGAAVGTSYFQEWDFGSHKKV